MLNCEQVVGQYKLLKPANMTLDFFPQIKVSKTVGIKYSTHNPVCEVSYSCYGRRCVMDHKM